MNFLPMVDRTEAIYGLLMIAPLFLGIAWIAWAVIKGMLEDE